MIRLLVTANSDSSSRWGVIPVLFGLLFLLLSVFSSSCKEVVVVKAEPDHRLRFDRYSGVSVADQDFAFQLMAHRYWNAPETGDDVPDEILVNAESGEEIRLHELFGEKPVVIIFGSASCNQVELFTSDFEVLSERFGDCADFHFVYLREAHPEGGFQPLVKRDSVEVDATLSFDPLTLEDRRMAALDLRSRTGEGMHYYVDNVDDALAVRWSAWPSRVFVMSADRKVIYAGGPGPFYFLLTKGSWHDPPPEVLENVFKRRPFDGRSLEEFLETLPKTKKTT